MTPKLILAVAAGGAFGSVLRYVSMSLVGRWAGSGFPWGTLFVNVVGSFIMGVLVEMVAQRWSMGEGMRALIFVGVLGGFTTFSTFSLDVGLMIERHQIWPALFYATLSVVAGVLALFGGLAVVRGGLS